MKKSASATHLENVPSILPGLLVSEQIQETKKLKDGIGLAHVPLHGRGRLLCQDPVDCCHPREAMADPRIPAQNQKWNGISGPVAHWQQYVSSNDVDAKFMFVKSCGS